MIELLWNAPVCEEKMQRILGTLDLSENARVMDVGCGCGEVLLRIGERYSIQGQGIDISAEHIAEANRRAKGRTGDSQIQFEVANGETFDFQPESQDLAICLGATHAFGLGRDAVRNAIKEMSKIVAPGGKILVADGYMRQPGCPEFHKMFGDTMSDEMTHFAVVTMGQQAGLIPWAAWTSTEDEWDEFEWGYQRIVEQKAVDNPTDQQWQTKRTNRREWIKGYLQWGRATLGYGTWLFNKPE